MDNKLTSNDIDVLMKALDAYKQKASSDALQMTMLMAIFSKEEDREQFKADADATMAEAKKETERLEEVVVILKAKLIMMRDQETVSSASDFLREGK